MSGCEPFALPGYHGEVATAWRPLDLAAAVAQIVDPAQGGDTVHWGRNYLWGARLETAAGPLEVVVKQFRNQGLRKRLRRRLGGSKAEKHWRAAQALLAAGLATPEPVLLVESERPEGPSFLVTRRLRDAVEARYYLRAVNAGRAAELYPGLPVEAFIDELAATLRRMHGAGIWHRDVSVGNLLLAPGGDGAPRLVLLDLNRARVGRRLGTVARSRDLARMRLFARPHQDRLLRAYWGDRQRGWPVRRLAYHLAHAGFHGRTELKRRLRAPLRGMAPRSAHPHIPPPPPGASRRDQVAWDALSDQPHQHAGRLARGAVRLADLPAHAAEAAACLRALPRIWRRYRRLAAALYAAPHPFTGVGVAVRPWPRDPDALLAAVAELGVRRIYLRLDTWAESFADEERLAAALAERGYELAFGVPQVRELVRDPERWERAVEEIGRRFTPYGRHFQIGQAINRSKWGVWRYDEYRELVARADRALRRHPGVELLGPAVIDFELYATAMALNLPWKGCRLDAVSSLLYVDRRGAPESRQLGFDTVGKVTLVKAIAETARNSGGASWITEVNWPLWEGPHAPAGRSVAVDEATQADYLARYYLLALATGLVERVYWWQLVARGYGLVCPEADGSLRRRPAFHALRTLAERLEGATLVAPLPAPAPARLYRFTLPAGGERIAAWSAGAPLAVELPATPRAAVGRDGEPLAVPAGPRVELTGSVRYYDL